MWGKNNHTICPEKPASHKVYQPQQLDTGGHSISQLTCGSWHAVAIAGKPVWQPKDEDTDEEMVVEEEGDGEQISPKKVTLLDGVEYFNEEQSDLETEVGSEPEYPSDGSTEEYHEHSLPPEFVKRREKTLLTLEEFYAPTPLPEVLTPAMTPRDTPLSQASPSPRKTLSGNNDAISEESSASPVGDGEAVNALQTEFQTATLESEKNDEEKESETREQIDSPGGGDHFDEKCEPGTFINPVFPIPPKLAKPSIPRQPLPHNRPINPYMTRSKTYAGDTPLSQAVQFSESPAEKFQLPREPSSVTNVDLLFESEKKFVINKHVPLQVNKKKPTVQLPPEHPLPVHLNRPKKLNVLRGYVSLDDRDHYEQMTDNPKSSRPHLTRAHTFYGRTAHNQRNVNPDYAVRGGGISVEAKSSCRKHANVASSPPARKNRKAEAEVKVIPVYPSGPWRARTSTQELSKKVFKS
ncbi:uncharacterized protein [Ptychodera flava]|uniref:uncharacterized protein n=1 Tax=Ptychodera flava TaxID=63121 RepID=UPI00396A416D